MPPVRQRPPFVADERTQLVGWLDLQRAIVHMKGLPRNIGAPVTRALTAAGYTDVKQLTGVPAAEFKKLHGVGPKALRLLQEELQRQGIPLG